MSWTEEEVMKFTTDNEKALADVNATLRPDKGLRGKVGIFCTGQAGDLATITSVLKYRNQVFGNKEIIWFVNSPNVDLLRYAPISEVRPWPWAGNGLPEGTPDFWPLLCNKENKLNIELSKNYELTKDLEDGYFGAPYMFSPINRHGIDYPNVSRKLFGLSFDLPWHPLLSFSHEDESMIQDFALTWGEGKNIFFETFAGSGQSVLDQEMVYRTMEICKQQWGNCNFIFASHKFLKKQESFPDGFFQQPNIYSAANFTVRQCALIANKCDLMISVSSGVTVASSCWGNHPIPILQFCGSWICSTKSLANGQFELVTADDKRLNDAKTQFYLKLITLLNAQNK